MAPLGTSRIVLLVTETTPCVATPCTTTRMPLPNPEPESLTPRVPMVLLSIFPTKVWLPGPVSTPAAVKATPYFSDPAVAPDRAEIAFVTGGDIWTAPLAGGEAHLLIAHAAYDSRPMYAPDGKRMAFHSTRSGNGDIYVYTFASGELQRLTFGDSNDQLSGWSRDGRWLYFHSNADDIAGNDVAGSGHCATDDVPGRTVDD